MRASLQSHTPLGNQVRSFVESGRLVPDETILGWYGIDCPCSTRAMGSSWTDFPHRLPGVRSWQSTGGSRRARRRLVLDAPRAGGAPVRGGSAKAVRPLPVVSKPPSVSTCDRCVGVLIPDADVRRRRFRRTTISRRRAGHRLLHQHAGRWYVDAIGAIDQSSAGSTGDLLGVEGLMDIHSRTVAESEAARGQPIGRRARPRWSVCEPQMSTWDLTSLPRAAEAAEGAVGRFWGITIPRVCTSVTRSWFT